MKKVEKGRDRRSERVKEYKKENERRNKKEGKNEGIRERTITLFGQRMKQPDLSSVQLLYTQSLCPFLVETEVDVGGGMNEWNEVSHVIKHQFWRNECVTIRRIIMKVSQSFIYLRERPYDLMCIPGREKSVSICMLVCFWIQDLKDTSISCRTWGILKTTSHKEFCVLLSIYYFKSVILHTDGSLKVTDWLNILTEDMKF